MWENHRNVIEKYRLVFHSNYTIQCVVEFEEVFFCVERGRCQSSSLFCAEVKLDVVAKPQRQGKKSRSIHVQRVEQLSGKPSNKKSFSLDSVQWKEAEMENERRLKDNCTTVLLLLCWCCVLAPISGERETLVNSYLSGIVFPGHFAVMSRIDSFAWWSLQQTSKTSSDFSYFDIKEKLG